MKRNIDTKRTAYLLGWPIDKSISPAFHNCVFEHLGLDIVYRLAPISNIDEARDFILKRDYCYLNVTSPYKKLALSCTERADGASMFAGGCNLVVQDCMAGYNLDGNAAINCIERAYTAQNCGQELSESFCNADGSRGNLRVSIFGTGPTALSAAFSISAKYGNRARILILSRSKEKCRVLNKHFASSAISFAEDLPGLGGIKACTYDCASTEIVKSDILINATTLGLKNTDPSPIKKNLITSDKIVLDCNYTCGETKLLQDARNAGAVSICGKEMLALQAWRTIEIALDSMEMSEVLKKAGIGSADTMQVIQAALQDILECEHGCYVCEFGTKG